MKIKSHVICFVLVSLFIVYVRSNELDHVCRRIRKRTHNRFITEPCIEKYKARCGWFSLTYCTFYHKVLCSRVENSTDVSYYQVLECCDGYIMAPNGTCLDLNTINKDLIIKIQNETAGSQTKDELVNPEDIPKDDSKDDKVKDGPRGYIRGPIKSQPSPTKKVILSHGAYAGIGCAVALILIILAFIIVAIRKKKLRQSRKRSQLDMENSIQRVVYQSSPGGKNRPLSDQGGDVQIDRQVIVQTESCSPGKLDSQQDDDPKEKLLDSPPKEAVETTNEKTDRETEKSENLNQDEQTQLNDDVSDDVTAKLLEGSSNEPDRNTHNASEETHDSDDDFHVRFENSTETNI